MKKNSNIPLIKCLVVFSLIFFCTACASRKGSFQGTGSDVVLADLKNFPQNLQIYADLSNPGKRLLSIDEQNYLTGRFEDIYFGPWQMRKTSVKKRDILPFFKKARGYKANGEKWSQTEWESFSANAMLASYPSLASPAISIRQTDLRELPTHEIRFDKTNVNINDYPFDYFQYSLLAPGMPLLVSHTSADGKWHYVECPIASGWVDSRDIAFVDEAFVKTYKKGLYAALIRDHVNFSASGKQILKNYAGIGAIFPVVNDAGNGIFTIMLPVKAENGQAKIIEAQISAKDAHIMPMPMTPANVALVGNVMAGQKYGWGGTSANRDCSAMTRDLFTPFGIWLPRNSAAQAKRWQMLSLEGLSANEKARMIMSDGVPFLSLLGMRGHIGLYVGKWKGQPAMFHNTWGIRIIRDGNDDERFVIGKAVVTSINPGIELENLYRPITFADRLRTLTTPGEKTK